MSFEVQLEAFAGPLQLLLDLIEREKLTITEVSLAKVTNDYVKYVDEHDVPSTELADFLVVAAKLIYLKSRAIMPQVAPEDEEADALEAQLKLYREFVDATVYIDQLLKAQHVAFARPANARALPQPKFLPPENATAHTLSAAFDQLLKRLQPFFTLQQTSMERVVSVQERIKQIHEVLLSRATASFRDITKSAASRVDVVVSFLALLELMKQRLVKATQSGAFADIELKRVD